MSGDTIIDTADFLGVVPKIIFIRAAAAMGFTNHLEVAEYRFLRWFNHGEIPQFVKDFCQRERMLVINYDTQPQTQAS